ncbi:MAG: S-layer homology domain-containing protein, partial [Sporomusa sp.]
KLAANGIISGDPEGTFRPQAAITRAEFATLVVQFANLSDSGDTAFPDVPDSHWAATKIKQAAKAGFISGDPEGTFRPDAPITRAEAVTILNRMLGRIPTTEHLSSVTMSFSDVSAAHWAFNEILEASKAH